MKFTLPFLSKTVICGTQITPCRFSASDLGMKVILPFLSFFILIQTLGFGQKSAFRTWNTRSVCAWVDPATGWNAQLMFKKVHRNQERTLQEVRIGAREKDAEIVRPLGHAPDGSYTELEMDWEGESLRIESAQNQTSDLFVLRVIRLNNHSLPLRLILSYQTIWNKEGMASKAGQILKGGGRTLLSPSLFSFDPCLPAVGQAVVVQAEDTTFFFLHKNKLTDTTEAKALIEKQRARYYAGFQLNKEEELARFAIQTCMAWNTIYDPTKNRVLHTVNRMWNVGRGGYVIFCWDNLFGSLLSLYGLKDTTLAFSNFRAVLEDATEDGFPSNNSQGNGRKAYDRSQPPVGGLVAKILFEKTKDIGFIRSVFPALYKWNAWWLSDRLNGKLLSYGSDYAAEFHTDEFYIKSEKPKNDFADPAFHTLLGAKLESGLDDSPMYDSTALVGSLMNLHDVGLNALYLSDCESLAHLAGILGKDFLPQKIQLEKTAAYFKKELQTLYSKKDGMFLNRYTTVQSPSRILSPTLLYPLLTTSPTPFQVQQMIDSLLLPPTRLGGKTGLPSIARNHPDFGKQRYWKGSVWPPLNFLVHRGLLQQNRKKEAEKLAESSMRLFMEGYKTGRLICENYSSINGRCDDPLINSEPYYFWGGLLALMKLDP